MARDAGMTKASEAYYLLCRVPNHCRRVLEYLDAGDIHYARGFLQGMKEALEAQGFTLEEGS